MRTPFNRRVEDILADDWERRVSEMRATDIALPPSAEAARQATRRDTGRRLTPHERARIVELRREGMTHGQIAERVGTSKGAVSWWLRGVEVPRG